MSILIGLSMLLAAPQPLPAGSVVGFKEGGHLVLTRQLDEWNFEYLPLPKTGKLPDVPVETDKLHFVMAHKDGATFLIVTNGFKTGYHYRASIGTEQRQVPTSICTVGPGLISIEHWSDEIDVMLLEDFRVSDEMVCKK